MLTGVADGTSAGTLLAFLFLLNLLVEPVQILVETLDQAQTAGAGLRRILGVLDTPVDVADPTDGVDLPEGGLDVRMEGVNYRYPDGGDDVLQNVSVRIEVGRRVAVVGETGSGKTTFAKLVTRLFDPTEGEVVVGGIPVNRVRSASLRSRVAHVPQEGFLFDASVADNVRYGRLASNDEGVRAAFTTLVSTSGWTRCPRGSTPLSESVVVGCPPGSGSWWPWCALRITNPDLLVLDEATSAVDPALEVQLRRAIERLTAGRTSITVAHRLSTAEAADEVLVFDEGRLVERGNHSELLERAGVYARLHADWAAGTASVA